MPLDVASTNAAPSGSPVFKRTPRAHLIASDAEAIEVARALAADFAQDAAVRDRERRLPGAELDRFSGSGLWGITVPTAYGGAGVSVATVSEVIETIAAADPSIGQIPQNHLGVVDVIRLTGTEEQKRFWFGKVLAGYRFGNAFSEAKSKHAGIFETTIAPDGGGFRINGEKFYSTGALFANMCRWWRPIRTVTRSLESCQATRRVSRSSTTGRVSVSARPLAVRS
jgi:alkylation response protein AidB-like acyl-CoA dehydrogenase